MSQGGRRGNKKVKSTQTPRGFLCREEGLVTENKWEVPIKGDDPLCLHVGAEGRSAGHRSGRKGGGESRRCTEHGQNGCSKGRSQNLLSAQQSQHRANSENNKTSSNTFAYILLKCTESTKTTPSVEAL